MNRVITCHRLPVIAVAAAFALGACSASGDGPASEEQAVRIVADDEKWETSGISELRSGWVSFTMDTVAGEVDHGLGLLRLTDGVTVDDVIHAESEAEFFELIDPVGGLVGIDGEASHTVTVRLAPGSYAMADFGGDDVPNFLRGMTAEFDVADGDGEAGVRPSSDGEIVMSEFAVAVPDGFTGNGTYLVQNAGGLLHELTISRFPAGVDVDEEIRIHDETGEGAGTEVPGLWLLGPGEEAYLELDLEPGSYAFACFIADPIDQPSHVSKGMYTPFTIG